MVRPCSRVAVATCVCVCMCHCPRPPVPVRLRPAQCLNATQSRRTRRTSNGVRTPLHLATETCLNERGKVHQGCQRLASLPRQRRRPRNLQPRRLLRLPMTGLKATLGRRNEEKAVTCDLRWSSRRAAGASRCASFCCGGWHHCGSGLRVCFSNAFRLHPLFLLPCGFAGFFR